MKRIIILIALSIFIGISGFAQKITTLRPQVERQSQDYVNIRKVELTDRYTIIYFAYGDENEEPRQNRNRSILEELLRRGLGGQQREQFISIDAKSRLYEPGNSSNKFKFIKAEGIPVKPDQRRVYPNDRVDFVVYYERLEPGIEVFDMYEGKDDGRYVYWNFFGVHIRNPKPVAKKPTSPPVKEEPPVVTQAPPPVIEEPQPKVEEKIETPTPAPVVKEGPKMVIVRGTVIDAKTKKSIPARLTYIIPSEENGLDSLQMSASTGKFKLTLEAGNRYGYIVSANGYFPATGAFDLTQSKAGDETTNEIALNPVAVGEAITLNNIYFEVSKYDLLPASHAELDRLAQLMTENPKMEIRVEGHTDNLGDFDKNVELSQNRANAVKKYLISKGINSVRIESKGYGPTRPISKGNSETERKRNRRVEFVVVKM